MSETENNIYTLPVNCVLYADEDSAAGIDGAKNYARKNDLTKDDVKIEDTIDNHLITGNDFTYFKNSEKIISKGKTKAYIDSKYKITSKNVTYLVNKDVLSSDNTTRIEDENSQVYFIERFNYQINQDSGLSNNTILSLFEDKQNNIWLGLDKGINCINNNSSLNKHTS